MSIETETSPVKVSACSKTTSSVTESPKAAVFGGTHAEKPHAHAVVKGEALAAVAHPQKESLRLLLAEFGSADSERRATAAEALGRLADIAAVPALIGGLRDSDADVARESAVALGCLGSAAAVEPLIGVLQNRDGFFHSVVRAAATGSLGQLLDRRAVVPLLNAINDPVAEISVEAIGALGAMPDPRSIPALLEVVRNEHGFFVGTTRRAAILALARIGGEQAACELRFVASNEWEDAVIRSTAIEATRTGSSSGTIN
jgi:HEAT repeat protein